MFCIVFFIDMEVYSIVTFATPPSTNENVLGSRKDPGGGGESLKGGTEVGRGRTMKQEARLN